MCRDDRECIEHCLNGHPDAFRHLVGRYQNVVLSYLAGQMGSRERAEEAAQVTFVRAYFGLNKLRKRESFFSWLLSIAGRVASQQRKVERRHKAVATLVTARPARSPEQSEEFALEKALGELPALYRDVVLLRYYAGRSCAEVAQDLGMPLGTVTKRLSRAYAMLRDALANSDRQDERCEVQP